MKTPLQSKTLWLNTLVAILALWDQVQPFIPQEWMPKAVAVVGVLNIILRFLTNQPVGFKPEEEGE